MTMIYVEPYGHQDMKAMSSCLTSLLKQGRRKKDATINLCQH